LNRQDWLVEEFERQRPHVRGVAYRMLGSVVEAEDAVQEAWVRLDRADPRGRDDLRGWLTVVIAGSAWTCSARGARAARNTRAFGCRNRS
jgi:RNA polymerase sigma-70 factor (ECF subfamily)